MTESNPTANQQWLDPFGNRIFDDGSNQKHILKLTKMYNFKITYELIILNVDEQDNGIFTCLVNNSLGKTKSDLAIQGKVICLIFCLLIKNRYNQLNITFLIQTRLQTLDER